MKIPPLLIKVVIILLVLLNLTTLFLIFSSRTNESYGSYKKKLDSLENQINLVREQEKVLVLERDSLIEVSKVYEFRIKELSVKKKILIGNRDKKDSIIISMPDDELFRLFSNLDSLSHKGRHH